MTQFSNTSSLILDKVATQWEAKRTPRGGMETHARKNNLLNYLEHKKVLTFIDYRYMI
ncbi:hypothetical protein TRIP_E230097 [uncultured Spirochaetota bacterium]|uniref:Uncharacterized protein n=1 Tax=uncultured Spirochaetota bacterium TaxID=460511 RepID=A0A652ZVV1_9SPIR|nr:hypothetical protein TRIP_E230097 [uncultured Spirochaetota bacterium]